MARMGGTRRVGAKRIGADAKRKRTAPKSGTRKGAKVASLRSSGILTVKEPHRATSQTASQIVSTVHADKFTVQRVDSILEKLRRAGHIATPAKKKHG
jgi:hypothetical protein